MIHNNDIAESTQNQQGNKINRIYQGFHGKRGNGNS